MSRSPNNPLPDFEDKHSMFYLIDKYLISISGGGFTYTEGWSDLLIAEEVNPYFKAHHAATVRRSKFGKLVTPPSIPREEPSRMDILEARVSRIIDILATNSPRSAQHRRYLLEGPSLTAHLDDI